MFGSAALAAQLTQVSNYNNNAKAKPGMYVAIILPVSIVDEADAC